MKKGIICFICLTLLFAINVEKVYANRGCCSWHGGVSHCDVDTGRIVCNDGSYSPSCTCSNYEELYDGSFNINSFTSCLSYIKEIDDLNVQINELEEENHYLNEEIDKKNNWIIILTIIMVVYVLYNIGSRRKEDNN